MLCGNVVDFSMFAPGVNFGCADGSMFLDAGAPKACGGGTSSTTSSSATSGSSSGSGSSGAGGADAG